MTVDVDRDLVISAKGLPVCRGGLHTTSRRPPWSVCGKETIVGKGTVDFEIAFPEQAPVRTSSKLVAYNAGVKGGVARLHLLAFITVPVPAAIVTSVETKRTHAGLRAVARVPVIAGGAGSVLGFKLRLKRIIGYRGRPKSYLTARCPDGDLGAKIGALFRNEAKAPGVAAAIVITGTVAFPCVPNG